VPTKRNLRLCEAIQREMGFILDRKVDDPRLSLVTVTRVELSPDLRYAKIYVSFLGDEERKREGMRLLRKARRFLRTELAGKIDVRVVPDLSFVLDESSENYLRIEEVLKKLHEEDAGDAGGGPEEGSGGA
jgi:ribosome-binding factor A